MKLGLLRLISSVSFFIFLSCAVKQAPSGGDEDKTPPAIISVTPEPGSTNVPVDIHFTIQFSKPMNEARTENSVFLTPVFWDYPKFKWSGKKLTVIPPEPLKKDITYVLTIGAGATGHHNNLMGVSQSYAFSTGSVIDSGTIAGSIYLEKGKPTAYDIWAYSVQDTISPVFLMEIPDYATQVDSAGKFQISNMARGHYAVISVDDKNDDLFWDPTSESIGLPPSIIYVEGSDYFSGLVLKPERRDTIPAAISRARPIDNRKLIVEFSQPVGDIAKLDIGNYTITSEDSIAPVVEGAFLGEQEKLILETSEQGPGISYKIHVKNLISDWGVPFDTAGARFKGSVDPDTAGPTLIATNPPNRSRVVYENRQIELIFSERVKAYNFINAVTVLADSTDTLKSLPEWIKPNVVRLGFPQGLPRETDIDVEFAPKSIFDIAGNPMPDSVLMLSFRFPPADTIGIVTIGTGKKGKIIGELYSRESRGESYIAPADNQGNINFAAVLPGTYYFRYFDDSDGNGVWSSGVVNPFKPAEWFSYVKDSVNVRARWTTEMGRID